MEISFKFNGGEKPQDIMSTLAAFFGFAHGATLTTEQVGQVSQTTIAPAAASPTIAPVDNPAVGADPEDTGTSSNQTHDAAGVPHDGRIHSDKRTLTAQGLWRKRKGVQDTTVAQVMGELKAKGLIVTPQPAPAVAPVAVVPAGPGATTTIITPASMVPPAAVVPPPVAAPVETPFQKLVNFLASHMQGPQNPAGRLTEQYINDNLKTFGFVGADGNGSVLALQDKDPAIVVQIHGAFANALGVPFQA